MNAFHLFNAYLALRCCFCCWWMNDARENIHKSKSIKIVPKQNDECVCVINLEFFLLILFWAPVLRLNSLTQNFQWCWGGKSFRWETHSKWWSTHMNSNRTENPFLHRSSEEMIWQLLKAMAKHNMLILPIRLNCVQFTYFFSALTHYSNEYAHSLFSQNNIFWTSEVTLLFFLVFFV